MKEYKPIDVKKYPKKSFKSNEAKKFKKFKETISENPKLTPTAVKICENNSNLISYFVYDQVYFYDLSNELTHTKYPFSKDQITAGNLRNDGKIIYSGLINGKVNIYEANKKTLLRSFKEHKLQINSIEVSPDMVNFVTTSNDMVSIL
jgi:WD40 repeat protein